MRAAVGHTQVVACNVISVSIRSWQDWEAGLRPMPSNLYRLYLHLTGQVEIPFGEAIKPKNLSAACRQ